MKNILLGSLFLLLCLLEAVSQAQEISWKKFTVEPGPGWKVKHSEKSQSSRLTLVSQQQGISAVVKLSAKSLTVKPVKDYQGWLNRYEAQWASMKFSNGGIMKRGPLTILGHRNCPVARGRSQSTFVCQFLPFVDGRVYSIVVNLNPYDKETLPTFVADLLQRMIYDGHGGIRPTTQLSDRPVKRIDNAQTPSSHLPGAADSKELQATLPKQFSDAELKTLDVKAATVIGLCESGDRKGLVDSILPGQQPSVRKAIENCSREELARFGNAMKSRRLKAVGRDLVEYEISDGEHVYAVSFIRVGGKWYLYHF